MFMLKNIKVKNSHYEMINDLTPALLYNFKYAFSKVYLNILHESSSFSHIYINKVQHAHNVGRLAGGGVGR